MFSSFCNGQPRTRGTVVYLDVSSIAFQHLHLYMSYSKYTRVRDDYLEFSFSLSSACRCFYLVKVIEAKKSNQLLSMVASY
jgi:hypothetical protein